MDCAKFGQEKLPTEIKVLGVVPPNFQLATYTECNQVFCHPIISGFWQFLYYLHLVLTLARLS